MTRDEQRAALRREKLDRLIVAAVDRAEAAGDLAQAGRLRLDRLSNALDGWIYAPPAKAARDRAYSRARREKARRVLESVHRYEQAQQVAS